jgi:phage terminase large subunit-like protein
LATQLTDDGFEFVAFGQGYASMNWPTKKLEELVLGCRLARGGHPVLRWMAGNVSIETDAADNWKTTKKYSPERTDGIVELIMALYRANPEKEGLDCGKGRHGPVRIESTFSTVRSCRRYVSLLSAAG